MNKTLSNGMNRDVHIDDLMTFKTHVNGVNKMIMGTLMYIKSLALFSRAHTKPCHPVPCIKCY